MLPRYPPQAPFLNSKQPASQFLVRAHAGHTRVDFLVFGFVGTPPAGSAGQPPQRPSFSCSPTQVARPLGALAFFLSMHNATVRQRV